MGSGDDVVRVQTVEFFDITQNGIHFTRQGGQFLFIKGQARQPGNMFHLGSGDLHGLTSVNNGTIV